MESEASAMWRVHPPLNVFVRALPSLSKQFTLLETLKPKDTVVIGLFIYSGRVRYAVPGNGRAALAVVLISLSFILSYSHVSSDVQLCFAYGYGLSQKQTSRKSLHPLILAETSWFLTIPKVVSPQVATAIMHSLISAMAVFNQTTEQGNSSQRQTSYSKFVTWLNEMGASAANAQTAHVIAYLEDYSHHRNLQNGLWAPLRPRLHHQSARLPAQGPGLVRRPCWPLQSF